MAWNNDDYVQVNERIAHFYGEYPDGSLQSEIVEFSDSRVVVKGYAYRNADDTRPATGHSYLTIPGSTNFTKGSELENAETSAWGRALAALGFEVKRGVASREEVQSKRTGPKKSHLVEAAKQAGGVEDLGTCEKHGEPWVRSQSGKVGHVLEGEQPCMKEEAAVA